MLELKSSGGQSFRCLITNSGAITLSIKGRIYNVDKSYTNYDKIKELIKDGDTDEIERLLNIAENLKKQFATCHNPNKSSVEIRNGEVLYNGEPIHSTLTTRILSFYNDGLPFEPLLKFFANLMENPSKRAVDELYTFLDRLNIPLTSDGFFLSYKSVRSDYYDKFSGKILNKPGTVVEIPRNTVSDDCTRLCDSGLHTGALEYAGPGGWYNSSGDKVVVVKVNPRDAVSVPADHSGQKLRVCRYEVVRDFDVALDKPLYEVKNDNITEYDCGCNDDYFDEDDNYEGYDDEEDFDDDEFDDEDDNFEVDTRDNYKSQKRDSNGRFC